MNRRFARTFASAVLLTALAGCSRENDNWRSAQTADSVEAYEQYLQQHPDSVHAVDAQARIVQLGEERDWQAAAAVNDAAAYRQFLAQHQDGKWAGEARIRAENLELTPAVAANSASLRPADPTLGEAPQPKEAPGEPVAASPAAPTIAKPTPPLAKETGAAPAGAPAVTGAVRGTFAVQLGAFATHAAAESQWQALAARHAAELRGLPYRIAASRSASGELYRLQAGALTEARARELCAALKAKSASCVIVPPR